MRFSSGIRHQGLLWLPNPTYRSIASGGMRLVPGSRPVPKNGTDPDIALVIALARLRDMLHVLSGVWDEGEGDLRRIGRLCRAAWKSIGADVSRAAEKLGTEEDRELMGRLLSGWNFHDYEEADAAASRLFNKAMARLMPPGSRHVGMPQWSMPIKKAKASEILDIGAKDFRPAKNKLDRLGIAWRECAHNQHAVEVDLNTLDRLDRAVRRKFAAFSPVTATPS